MFFYPGSISHVGLYAGNGTILHASRPGKPVQYIKMSVHAVRRRPPSRLILATQLLSRLGRVLAAGRLRCWSSG